MVERILVCNIRQVGDVILTTAALPALKAAFPHAKIGFLTASWSQMVVLDHKLVDWVHCYDHPNYNRKLCRKKEKRRQGKLTFAKAISEIKNINYDLAFDFYSRYKCNAGPLLSLAKIPQRVGFWPSKNHFFFNHQVFIGDTDVHIVKLNERLLNGFDIPTSEFTPFLSYHEEVDYCPPFDEFILIHMGAGRKVKKWPLEYWESLVKHLSLKGFPLIFLGKGAEENQEIETVTKSLKNHLNLCDRLSWKELLSLMKKAKLLIGHDSMAAHLAAVCNTPTVLIFGELHLIDKWRPLNALCHIVSPKDTFKGDQLALKKLTVEEVLQKVQESLSLLCLQKIK